MSRWTAVYAVALCILGASACAVDSSSEPSQGTDNQAVTTPPMDHTFANGCRVIFWCHNDLAGQRPAFCTLSSNCDNTTVNRASAFCTNPNICSPLTNCHTNNIQDFGVCD